MPVLALNFNPVDPLGSLSSWIVDGAIEAWRQACSAALGMGNVSQTMWQTTFDLSLIHIPSPRDRTRSRMPSSA